MTRTPIGQLSDKIGERGTIRGWVNAVRNQKRMQFLIVRDETGLAQAVVEAQDPPSELNWAISTLTAESAVTVTGMVVADERSCVVCVIFTCAMFLCCSFSFTKRSCCPLIMVGWRVLLCT